MRGATRGAVGTHGMRGVAGLAGDVDAGAAESLGDTTSMAAPPAGARVRVARGAAPRVALGLAWTVAVLLAYYAVHKPVTAGDLAALRAPAVGVVWDGTRVAARVAGEAADLATAVWAMLLAGALGHVLWHALRLPDRRSAEAELIGTVLGFGALGLAAFAAGALGGLTPLFAWGVLVIPSLVLARQLLARGRWWARAAGGWWRAAWHGGRIERFVAISSGVTLGLAGLAALLPPTTAWDALSYHLVGVRADATAGHTVLDPSNPALYHPRLVEGVYTLLWLVRGGDGALAPLHAACGVLAVSLVALLGWRAAGPRGGVRAAGLALGMPVIGLLASWPYVDLALAAAALAAIVAVVRWGAAREAGTERGAGAARGWLVAGALAGGLALDVKYSGGYALAALAALVAFASAGAVRGYGPFGRARSAILCAGGFLGLGLIVGSPWLVRNLVVTGDPIFPLHLGALFAEGPGWDPVRTWFMEGKGWGWSALWRAPLVPIEATVLGKQYTSEFDADIGPLLLLLLPLGLLTRGMRANVAHGGAGRAQEGAQARAPTAGRAAGGGGRPPDAPTDLGVRAPGAGGIDAWCAAGTGAEVVGRRGHDDAARTWRWSLGFAGLMLVIWGVELARTDLAEQSRIFLPLLLAACVPAAVAWIRLEGVRTSAVSLGRLTGAAVALSLALAVLGQAAQTLEVDNLAELAGLQDRQTYLAQQLGPYAAAMRELDTLGPRARVLLLWEPRSYLTTAHVAPDIYLDNFNALYRHCGDAAGIARCLSRAGYTHVLIYEEGLRIVAPNGKDPPRELAELAALRANWRDIYQDDTPLLGPGPPQSGWYVLYAVGDTP